jgi:3-oxoacyl-[acyl-carrier protein] reductase
MERVVITGGTGGLGTAIASVLGDHGWATDALGRKDLDMKDPHAIACFFDEKPVDLLICAAGITGDAVLARQNPDTWDEVMDVNFGGAEKCARAAASGMISRGRGHIIFLSSYSALHPPVGQSAYATSKAALLGLTADLATRYGPSGLRVNAVLPGFLETPMTAGIEGERRQEILGGHRLGRFNTPGAVAAFIRFLHEELPHTSGQIFQLDSRRSAFL